MTGRGVIGAMEPSTMDMEEDDEVPDLVENFVKISRMRPLLKMQKFQRSQNTLHQPLMTSLQQRINISPNTKPLLL